MDKFLRLKIKTKLTFGIGLLFTMIVLLGGLAVQNITCLLYTSPSPRD